MAIDLDAITLDPASLSEVTDLREAFAREAPIELEIGIGKGTFLLRRAQAHPERNFLGIEWANQFYRYAADRLARWGLTNVRVLRTDAKHFVIHRLAPACLVAIHIYHPDPWPKKRHQKRRLIQKDFVDAAVRVLAPGGRLAIQTDHAEYFEQIRGNLCHRPELEQVAFEDEEYGTIEGAVRTNFEVKYEREGRTFYRLAFRRR